MMQSWPAAGVNWRATALKVVVPVCLLLAWAVATGLHWIPQSVLPAPAVVGDTFLRLLGSGELLQHALVSLRRVLLALGLGTLFGVMFGVAVALSPRFRDYVNPVFQVLVYVPILAWLPLLMVVLGIGEALKIVLLVKVVFVPVAFNAIGAIRDIPPAYRELADVFDLRLHQRLWKVYFPAAFMPIWGGIRYAHARAWAALVVVEMLASSDGLGYLLVEGQNLLQVDLQVSAILMLVVLGFSGDRLLGVAYRWKSRWSGRAVAY